MRLLMWMLALCAGAAAMAGEPVEPSSGAAAATAGAPPEGAAGEAAAAESMMAQARPQPAGSPCRSSADRFRAVRLQRALAGGFGVQYWGDGYSAAELADQPHGLLIIEVAKVGAPDSESGREEFFTPDEVALISRDGERPVLGYLNVSEIEPYRDYWIDVAAQGGPGETRPPEWLGPYTGNGERLSAFWVPAWRDMLIARVDLLMATGIDGLFLDDVLHYYSHATDGALRWPEPGRPDGPEDAPGLALAMMEVVIAVAERVRMWDCDAVVVVNNGVFIGRDANEVAQGDGTRPVFEAYLAAIDAILVENALSPAAHPDTRVALVEDFLDNGLKVLTLDVLSRFEAEDAESLRLRLAAEAQAAGFVPYLVEDSGFNRLWAPVVRSEGSQARASGRRG